MADLNPETQVFEYVTGRVYNGAQALAITLVQVTPWDEFDSADGVLTFEDKSRGIKGVLTYQPMMFKGDKDCNGIGRVTLAAYDAGAYILAV